MMLRLGQKGDDPLQPAAQDLAADMAGQPGGAPKEQILKGVVRRKNVVLGDDLARMREQHAHLFRQKEAAPQIAPLRNGGAIGADGPLLQRRLYGLQKGQGDVVAEAQRATPHVPAPLKADVPVLGDAEHMEKAALPGGRLPEGKFGDNLKLIAHEVQDAGNTGKPEKEAPRSLPQGDGVPGQAERPLQFLVFGGDDSRQTEGCVSVRGGPEKILVLPNCDLDHDAPQAPPAGDGSAAPCSMRRRRTHSERLASEQEKRPSHKMAAGAPSSSSSASGSRSRMGEGFLSWSR